MSNIGQILHLFFSKPFSQEITNRVHTRIAHPLTRTETDEALETLWLETAHKQSNRQTIYSYRQVEQKLGLAPHPSSLQFWLKWVRIAALWIIPIASALTSLYFFGELKEVQSIAMIEHYVPRGSREQLILPDRSTVWINGGTLLIYPEKFSNSTREVYLAGEANFEVRKEKKPFVVKTRVYNVRVLGTLFNISAYPNDDYSTTTLQEGSVQISIHSTHSSYLLVPNDQLSYNNKTGEVIRQTINSVSQSEWKEGYLCFHSESFTSAILKVERTYGVNIRVMNRNYNSHLLTVNFNKDETIDKVMEVIQSIVPGLKYTIDGTNIYIH